MNLPQAIFSKSRRLYSPLWCAPTVPLRDALAGRGALEHPRVARLVAVLLISAVAAVVISYKNRRPRPRNAKKSRNREVGKSRRAAFTLRTIAQLEGPRAVVVGALELADRADAHAANVGARLVRSVAAVLLAVTVPVVRNVALAHAMEKMTRFSQVWETAPLPELGNALGVVAAARELPLGAVGRAGLLKGGWYSSIEHTWKNN